MRTAVRTLVILVASALVVLLAFAMLKKGQPDEEPKPALSSPAAAVHDQSPSPAQTSSGQGVDVPPDLAVFASVFADQNLPTDRWLEALLPVSTPALHASLRSMDRPLSAQCGAEIIEVAGDRAVLGRGGTPACGLTLQRVDAVESGRARDGVQVAAVDFMESQRGAVPVSSTTQKTLAEGAQQAALVVVAQPGGYTDEARKAAIAAQLKAPSKVWAIPRFSSEGEAIRVGNIRDFTLSASEDGKLVATMTVPYAKDGQRQAQWAFLTLIYGRGPSGQWVLEDISQ